MLTLFPFLSVSRPISYWAPAYLTISNAFFVKTLFSKQDLISPFSSWGHPCQWDCCEPVGGMSCSHKERMVQPLLKHRTFWEHAAGWVSLQTHFLPGKQQHRDEEEGNGVPCTPPLAGVQVECAPNPGPSHSLGKTRGTKVFKFNSFWYDRVFNHTLQPWGAVSHIVYIQVTTPMVLSGWEAACSTWPNKARQQDTGLLTACLATWGQGGDLLGHRIQTLRLTAGWAASAASPPQQTSTSTVW